MTRNRPSTVVRSIAVRRPRRLLWPLVLATLMLSVLLLAQAARAHAISRVECAEGSEFIMDAAKARDLGTTRDTYLTQLSGDLEAIRAFPPELRWFVQDEEDEALLTSAALEVFDDPHDPDTHRRDFLARCLRSPSSTS